mgnify:CR=1 FL=1
MDYKVGTLVVIKEIFSEGRIELGVVAEDTGDKFSISMETLRKSGLVIWSEEPSVKTISAVKIKPYDQDFWLSYTMSVHEAYKEFLWVEKKMFNSIITPFMFQFGDAVMRKDNGHQFILVKITWEGQQSVKNGNRRFVASNQFLGTYIHLKSVDNENRSLHIKLADFMEYFDLIDE